MTAAAEVVIFPDATAEVVDYLRANLGAFGDTAEVVERIPSPRPDRLVKVTRTGGARVDLIRDRAQVTVECWDTRDDLAHDLAAVCRGLLAVMPDRHAGATVYRSSEVGGPVPLPDPDTASPRFTFTTALDFRGTAAE